MERLAAEIRKYGPETKREGGWKITCWRDRITERPGCSLSADLVGSSGQTEGLLSITRRGSGHMQITVVSDKSLGTQWLKYRVDEHAADSLQCLNSKCFWELAPDSEIYAQIQTGERFHTVLGGSLVSADITGLAGAWPLFDDMRQKWGAE